MIATTQAQHREGIGQHLYLVSLLDNDLCPAYIAIRSHQAKIEYSDGKADDDP
ncbi:hypothetical protein D3C75_1150940 [compost metagenome]